MVRYEADPPPQSPNWFQRWIWHPTRVDPPENSGETLVRFAMNLVRVAAVLFVLKLLVLFLFFWIGIIAAILLRGQ